MLLKCSWLSVSCHAMSLQILIPDTLFLPLPLKVRGQAVVVRALNVGCSVSVGWGLKNDLPPPPLRGKS